MARRQLVRLTCPHCGSHLAIRTSTGITPVYREAYVHCTNVDECGWRGKLAMEMTTTLCPSQCPNPEVNLPLSQHLRAALLEQLLPEAN